jgi:aspartate aminotransferase-like enzyme/ribosomal protein S18 acetylase RimI-like enzyme
MYRSPMIDFRIAESPDDFEQIHRLNYRTFVEEIPQHAANLAGVLVDKFHAENTYFIGVAGTELVGMLAVRANRPFSLDAKLADLDRFLPPHQRVCEIRLLAVDPRYRHRNLFVGLLRFSAPALIALGFDLAVISGTLRQSRLYRHLGFVPFGPVVGTQEAPYQPMFLAPDRFVARNGRHLHRREHDPIALLPGPVIVDAAVARALQQRPVSHRDPAVMALVARIQQRLKLLTMASYVEILVGTGTLANDVVAQQLRRLNGHGLVVATGEFGDRLVDHARRAGLTFDTLRVEWGCGPDRDSFQRALERRPVWVWCVHCETSTGVLHDLRSLGSQCVDADARLVVDCVSSLGVVPVDLENVWLASGSSGKGLGAAPGLALVFHAAPIAPDSSIPRYLDAGLYAQAGSIPFTHSSNLLAALDAALEATDFSSRVALMARRGPRLRALLQEAGFTVLGDPASASPAVASVALDPELPSIWFGELLGELGVLVAYRSRYLLERNWIQLALMSRVDDAMLERAVAAMRDVRALARLAQPCEPLFAGGSLGAAPAQTQPRITATPGSSRKSA